MEFNDDFDRHAFIDSLALAFCVNWESYDTMTYQHRKEFYKLVKQCIKDTVSHVEEKERNKQ